MDGSGYGGTGSGMEAPDLAVESPEQPPVSNPWCSHTAKEEGGTRLSSRPPLGPTPPPHHRAGESTHPAPPRCLHMRARHC